jgi:geranylgeranyl diphosphate synthase type II
MRTTERRKCPSENMRVQHSLAAKKRLIERELERILSRDDSRLLRVMRYAVLPGGKRFRPLLLLSSGACFQAAPRLLLPFACAIELIHNYSLVHDDLPSMDNDDLRRGKPTCHRAFGEDLAILAGDGLLTLAFEVMAGAAFPDDALRRKQEAIGTISRSAGIRGLIGGQVLDITLKPEKITRPKIDELIRKKTGALIVAAVEVGAILGRASRAERQAIREYGEGVGLAFQVRDDILDSRRKKKTGVPERPDYVVFVGEKKAAQRLEGLVRRAVNSLARFSGRAEELRWLALSLLEPGREVVRA